MIFQLLLSGAYAKSRSILLLRLPASKRLCVHKELGGDRTRTADPDWTKGCPIPYGVMLNHKTGGAGRGVCCCLETGWASVSWLVVSNCVEYQICFFFFPSTLFFYLLLRCPYINLQVLPLFKLLLLLFSQSFHFILGKGEQRALCCLVA